MISKGQQIAIEALNLSMLRDEPLSSELRRVMQRYLTRNPPVHLLKADTVVNLRELVYEDVRDDPRGSADNLIETWSLEAIADYMLVSDYPDRLEDWTQEDIDGWIQRNLERPETAR